MDEVDLGSADPWWYIPEQYRNVRYDIECGTIPGAVRRAALKYPDIEAIVDGDLRLTFADLEGVMLGAVGGAIALGIEPGDRAAILAPNGWEWIIAALAIQGAGGIVVPINTRFKGPEAAFALKKSGASAIFVGQGFLGTDYLSMLRDADPTLPSLAPGRVVLLSGAPGDAELSWDDFVAGGQVISREQAIESIDAVSPDSLSDIMFTSGTTGYPKGVMSTHAQTLRCFGWYSDVLEFRPGRRFAIVPPFFHSFGYKAGWLGCIIHGVTILPVKVFDPEALLRQIDEEKVSILLGPPTIFQGILDSPNRDKFDLSSIEVAMPSSASAAPELVRRLRDEFDTDVIVNSYGLTEATAYAVTTLPHVDDHDDVLNTVGRAKLDVELRVIDADGNDVPTGVPGELLIRGFNVMKGYWDEPELTAQVIDADGWLKTGDIVTRDSRGYIRVTDRKKDMIIVGGFNVYPAEVELILSQHPDIVSIAVVGMPDERLGEVPAAFIEPKPGATIDHAEFIEWARNHIANFKVPRQVTILDELPRNASMKVLKTELRRRLIPREQ